jgi:hypothetical protein
MCPRCSAKPGHDCAQYTGEPVITHVERIEAAVLQDEELRAKFIPPTEVAPMKKRNYLTISIDRAKASAKKDRSARKKAKKLIPPQK